MTDSSDASDSTFDPFSSLPSFDYFDGSEWHHRSAADFQPFPAYRSCLGCSSPLTVHREQYSGLHAHCASGYRVGARFVRPGDEADRLGHLVCAGCGQFFLAHGDQQGFAAYVRGWWRKHEECFVVAALPLAA